MTIRKPKDMDRFDMDHIHKWTLTTCKEFCDQQSLYAATTNQHCEESGCELFDRGICSREWCSEWDLRVGPVYTREEIQLAKLIAEVYPLAIFYREPGGTLFTKPDGTHPQWFPEKFFPNIHEGSAATIKSIAESGM